MGVVATYQYVVYSITLFTVICIALFYMLTGRGQRAGDIRWLLEGMLCSFVPLVYYVIFTMTTCDARSEQELIPSSGVEWE